MFNPYNPMFGNYRTDTFAEIVPDAAALKAIRAQWIALCPAAVVSDEDLELIWALLTTRFGESHVASTNSQTFVLKLISLIGETAPKFLKDLAIQRKLAALNIESDADMALIANSKIMVANHADHPSTSPAMSDFDALSYIDAQNTSTSKRGTLESLASLSILMRSDLYTEFTDRFKKLFIQIAMPQSPLWYVSGEED